ncbi:conserved Plasmodium protein, unknown function [Plasmodium sp. DRC-Itaito]|nr:conserved Plasmodium protein, unknown function [Plasmodium sp. DRC-Itaito]
MKSLSLLFVRRLIPCVSLNKINSVYLLKHLENVCEHIWIVGKYSPQKLLRRGLYSNKMKKKKNNKEIKMSKMSNMNKMNKMSKMNKMNKINNSENIKEEENMRTHIDGENKIYNDVYKYFNKSIVLLHEFGPSGILRLLYSLLKIKGYDEKYMKRKRIYYLKYIEYYILNICINDKIYNFWKYVTFNDTVLMFKMFIKNDYFSYKLLNTLYNEIKKNLDYSISSDLIVFLYAYNIYKKRIRKKKYYNVGKEICVPNTFLIVIYKKIMNNLNLSNKEITQFIIFFSIYGYNIPLEEKIYIYNKCIKYIEQTIYMYSSNQLKYIITSFFKIYNFIYTKKNTINCMEQQNKNLVTFHNFINKLFIVYNERNIDTHVDDEYNILHIAVKNNYYNYECLEYILFNIKKYVSHMNTTRQIKFIELLKKIRDVYNKEHDEHKTKNNNNITCSNSISNLVKYNTTFKNSMIQQILRETILHVNMIYKNIPRKIKRLLIEYDIKT